MNKQFRITCAITVVCIMLSCASQKNQNATDRRSEGRSAGPPTYSQLLEEMDTNKDGLLATAEVRGPIAREISKIDSNGDGYITRAEFENAPRPQRGQGPPRND